MAIQNDPAADITLQAATAVDVDAVVAADANLRLVGYAIKESAGVAAEFRILQGATVAAGTEIGAHHHLAANESKERWFGADGIKVPGGLSLDRVAGTAKVAFYTRKVI